MSAQPERDVNDNYQADVNEIYKIRDQDQTKEFYSNWAETYEKDTKGQGFNGAFIVVKHFLELGVPKEARILDVGSGTGVIGQLLAGNGYENVDALDGVPKMLEFAKQKKCYKNFITSYVSSDIRLPIEDNTYDVVIMSGVFCPGHIRVEAFEQIVRVVKPGGIICWSMGAHENYADRDEQFRDRYFSNHLQSLCDKKLWAFIEPNPIRVRNFYLGKDGLFYAMKVL